MPVEWDPRRLEETSARWENWGIYTGTYTEYTSIYRRNPKKYFSYSSSQTLDQWPPTTGIGGPLALVGCSWRPTPETDIGGPLALVGWIQLETHTDYRRLIWVLTLSVQVRHRMLLRRSHPCIFNGCRSGLGPLLMIIFYFFITSSIFLECTK